MHSHFGHDEIYLLAGTGTAFYAQRDGSRLPPAAYDSAASVVRPLVAELKARIQARAQPEPGLASPGAADIAVINGHPAIVSVKPIVTRSGSLIQRPGTESLHVSIRRLDGTFVQNLKNNYRFAGARFAWTDARRPNEYSLPFVSPRSGRNLGYFIWEPFAPGSTVFKDIVPGLILTLILIGAIVSMLIRRIRRGTAQLRASEAQSRHLAFHDALTGLPNRALFNDRMNRALAVARRDPGRQVALLALDLDRFKTVNDTLGHPAGDELIREVGNRLSKVIREADTVARLGGDEFAIVQMGVRSKRDIDLLCKRILAAIDEPVDVVGSRVHVGVSIGVARSSMDGYDGVELSRKADIALYHAKHHGRGRHSVFAKGMDATIQLRKTLEQDLRTALEQGDQLEVYYQPQYDARTAKMSGVEALVRWHHPAGGRMSPVTFIPIAEESGLIEALGEWVLREACTAAREWPLDTLSVNVSAVQLRNPLFARSVLAIVEASGFDPARLELEITETSFINTIAQCAANLRVLRAAGIRIALDDFGTGYSSFNHLRDFEIDRVKIDQTFIRGIGDSAGDGAIIEAIVNLAQSNGLKITAEGVETAEQSDFVRDAGCDELQGFLMSHPLPRHLLEQLFINGHMSAISASLAA